MRESDERECRTRMSSAAAVSPWSECVERAHFRRRATSTASPPSSSGQYELWCSLPACHPARWLPYARGRERRGRRVVDKRRVRCCVSRSIGRGEGGEGGGGQSSSVVETSHHRRLSQSADARPPTTNKHKTIINTIPEKEYANDHACSSSISACRADSFRDERWLWEHDQRRR